MPTASTNPATLSQRINIATRPLHTQLNALIICLLPLALPPHISTPQLYGRGLSHILPIYEAFEGAFRLLLLRNEWNERDGHGGKRKSVIEGLRGLHMPELERVERLRKDSNALLPAAGQRCPSRSDVPAPKLKDFTRHISTTLQSHPHLLLTYTWIFYMALFSGGRYVHGRLGQAGLAFWGAVGGEKTDADRFFNFWTFEGGEDGEDIKAEFKRRFNEVDECLMEEEREDVVAEAVFIMQSMVGIVHEIAETIGSAETAGQHASLPKEQDEIHKRASIRGGDEPSMRWLVLNTFCQWAWRK